MLHKTLMSLVLTGSMLIGAITPAIAGGVGTLLGVGAGALFLTQSAHNRHVHNENVNLYKSNRMKTFWYNGKKVNCHYENGSKACFEKDGNTWNYIPDR